MSGECPVNVSSSEFDQELANTYIGKYILVGVTYLDQVGNQLEQIQLHGTIESANPEGIKIALGGQRTGESWGMPPDLSNIYVAEPGIYNLHSTGESIENPDLLVTWSVHKGETPKDST
jgi:hypothetical protein